MSTMNVQPIGSRNTDSDLLEKDAVYCQRCSGLMSYENFYDLGDDTGQLQFSGWRCFSCGNIWDHVIADHCTRRVDMRAAGRRRGQRFPFVLIS